MPSTIQTRLRRLMADMHWSQADVVRASGASAPAVSRWLKDGHLTIHATFGFRLQDQTGFSARWILLGEGRVRAVDSALEILHEAGFTAVKDRQK